LYLLEIDETKMENVLSIITKNKKKKQKKREKYQFLLNQDDYGMSTE